MKDSEVYGRDLVAINLITPVEVIKIHNSGYKGIDASVYVSNIDEDIKKECLSKLPEYVGGDFRISENGLLSLDLCPTEIKGTADCFNKEMERLGGKEPIHIGGDLKIYSEAWCNDNGMYTICMTNIKQVGEIIVDGQVMGFDTESFIENKPDKESLANAIALLTSCKMAHEHKEDIAILRNQFLIASADDVPDRPSTTRRF